MKRALALVRAALVMVIAWPACHGQFDFDTNLLDSGQDAPTTGIDASGEETSNDATTDRARPDIHIACGASSCEVSGCCSTSSGATCTNIAAGETCGGLLIQCDDSDDCGEGMVCCAEGETQNADARECSEGSCHEPDRVRRVHCEPEAHCAELKYIVLCNPDRPRPCTECVASMLSGLPPGYHQCADSP